jgi:hypothetical protein
LDWAVDWLDYLYLPLSTGVSNDSLA